MKKFSLSRSELEQLYETPYSLNQISSITGSSVTAIRYRMVKWNIARRSFTEAEAITLSYPDIKERLGRRPNRFSKHSLSKTLTDIRQALYPLLQYQRQGKKCSLCSNPATVMHHDPQLVTILDDLLKNGLSPLEATIQIVKDHYNGVIRPEPRCKEHHNH